MSTTIRSRIAKLEDRINPAGDAPWLSIIVAIGGDEKIPALQEAALRERYGESPRPAEVNWIVRRIITPLGHPNGGATH